MQTFTRLLFNVELMALWLCLWCFSSEPFIRHKNMILLRLKWTAMAPVNGYLPIPLSASQLRLFWNGTIKWSAANVSFTDKKCAHWPKNLILDCPLLIRRDYRFGFIIDFIFIIRQLPNCSENVACYTDTFQTGGSPYLRKLFHSDMNDARKICVSLY